jgi:hypothetical protein
MRWVSERGAMQHFGTLGVERRTMHRRAVLRWLGAAAGIGLPGDARVQPQEVYVIAHHPLKVAASEIREVFLGERQFVGALRVVPVDNLAAQPRFLERVLKMTPARYAAWWTRKAFREGINAPLVKAGDAQVLRFVSEVPGAIAYLTQAPPPGVHLLERF